MFFFIRHRNHHIEKPNHSFLVKTDIFFFSTNITKILQKYIKNKTNMAINMANIFVPPGPTIGQYQPDAIRADGKCVLGNLVLHDRKTGKEWEIYIDDGKIYAEPWDKDERRDHRIEKVLGE
jgi:hypothetical protein